MAMKSNRVLLHVIRSEGQGPEEFIAASGYHEKSAIRVLNETPAAKQKETRRRSSLDGEATSTHSLCFGRPRIGYAAND